VQGKQIRDTPTTHPCGKFSRIDILCPLNLFQPYQLFKTIWDEIQRSFFNGKLQPVILFTEVNFKSAIAQEKNYSPVMLFQYVVSDWPVRKNQ
jgi:hypothetical protein